LHFIAVFLIGHSLGCFDPSSLVIIIIFISAFKDQIVRVIVFFQCPVIGKLADLLVGLHTWLKNMYKEQRYQRNSETEQLPGEELNPARFRMLVT
jgi:hypothetical protein